MESLFEKGASTAVEIRPVKDVMTRSLITFHTDTQVKDAIEILIRKKISGAPVVDAAGKLVGMFSEKDGLKVFIRDAYVGQPLGTVGEVMSSRPEYIDEDVDVFRAAEIFILNHFRRLPVLDSHKYLVGLVSRKDILSALQRFL
jgi:CBS domain-containing protein